MRDWRTIIEALERKANDGACPQTERDALLAKASELRIKHKLAPVIPINRPRTRVINQRVYTQTGTGTWTTVDGTVNVTISFARRDY